MEVIAMDRASGVVVLALTVTEKLTGPARFIMEPLLSAILTDIAALALRATLGSQQWLSLTNLNLQYLKPMGIGPLAGHGQVVRRDGDCAILHASLTDSAGDSVAAATASATVTRLNSGE
ncbi:hypothetical protein ACFZC5_36070 [Nocardia gamkensis]|uniref:hypothetical protein n=1 Tax=Nocardia gamkensis TaxID=352869 RepID=UPI0036E03E5A